VGYRLLEPGSAELNLTALVDDEWIEGVLLQPNRLGPATASALMFTDCSLSDQAGADVMM